MYIFIDEAGTFTQPQKKTFNVCCVGGLVIPENFLHSLERRFRHLRRSWGFATEIKGSRLSEKHVAEFIELLASEDVVFFCETIDMGLQKAAELEEHKRHQAKKVRDAILTLEHQSVKDYVELLACNLEKISNQEYVQITLQTMLVSQVIRNASLYYSTRIPAAVSRFHWRFDGKQPTALSRSEALWRDLSLGFLQSISFRDPFITLKNKPLKGMRKYEIKEPKVPAHLRKLSTRPEELFQGYDLKKILLSDLKFCNSKDVVGLQMIDILVTSIRRACNGNLQKEGWREIGKLMVQAERGRHPLKASLLSLDKGWSQQVIGIPYNDVFRTVFNDRKPMFPRGV